MTIGFKSEATIMVDPPRCMRCRRKFRGMKRHEMKSRVQHDDDDAIGANVVKRESVALTVEFERYIPPDLVRPQSFVPSSDHLGTSC